MTLKSRILALGAAAMMTLPAPLAAEGWNPDGALTLQDGFCAG